MHLKKEIDQIEVLPADEDDVIEKQEFDDRRRVPPIDILRVGLATMQNEMGRLVKRSKARGLNGQQAYILKEYVKTCSDIMRKHKSLNIDAIGLDDLETASDERLAEMILGAAKSLSMDITDMNILPKPKASRKAIAHED